MEGGSIRPVGIGNLGNATDDHLRGKFGRLPCFVVFGLMERELIEIFRLERMAGKRIAKTITGFQRLEENLRLFFGRLQFQVDCHLHPIYSKLEFNPCQPSNRKESAFLPGVNAEVSNARTG